MPTYAYECEACGHTFELFQSMTASVKRKCPECGKNKLQRLIGKGAAILFKGDGFYETDYRSESYKSAAKSDQPKSDSKESKKDSPSTAKPKSKPKPKAESD
ncbi:MAG: zinc ribbon domain-containing protein [Planctomycetes bacterium]|nr:zinc ribbon domain-containing protein [Planctomycetota bacterium]